MCSLQPHLILNKHNPHFPKSSWTPCPLLSSYPFEWSGTASKAHANPRMGMMHHPGTHILARNVAPRPTPTRRALPHRKVTSETIEHAYAQFILYCNPGVPPETDTAVLRDAFRVPPKSGGKSFSTYTLFELIGLFQAKEIKTWADLALQLGVDPPDQDKGQSAQKIQQYAVRLKRWMHSMHIDAFFDYLLGNPHPYWTDIPTDPNPVLEEGRDGVSAEDDMALRSLLPQIRPRRGRKRPENEDSSRSPSQRPRTESGGEELGMGGTGGDGGIQPLDLWPAHPGATPGSVVFPSPSQDQFSRLNLNLGTSGAIWTGENFAQTPLTAHSYSAMTPSPGQAFWPGQSADSKPVVASAKPKTNKRHGAKVVSSAWRSGGPGGPGKTRGRPPLNRQNTGSTSDASPFHAFPAQSSPTYEHISPHMTPSIPTTVLATSPNISAASMASEPQSNLIMNQQHTAFDASMQDQPEPRNLRPTRSRLSLQVPERTGAEVRLATPPGHSGTTPMVMINGRAMRGHQITNFGNIAQDTDVLGMEAFGTTNHTYDPLQQQQQQQQQEQQHYQQHAQPVTSATMSPNDPFTYAATTQQFQQAPSSQHQTTAQDRRGIHFTDPTDRTNLDELESFFIYDIVGADWFDSAGNQIPACSVDEAAGIYQQVIEDVMKGAASKETFLINVAALVGGSLLRSGRSVKVHRTMSDDASSVYDCHWELRLGDIKGAYSIRVTLPHSKWRGNRNRGRENISRGEDDEDAEGEEDDSEQPERDDDDDDDGDDNEKWQKKYRDLLQVVQQQKSELSDIRKGMLRLFQQPRTANPSEGPMQQ
ncbi:hypothetical protein N8I77_006589 [Diaporthe amygdali]|uniref:ARS-binding protein 2 n=1 Tax=Phomopsis amygdali TaxID=1214568 RepID=A0AAD9SIB7_PHOAM|nr:hypothetical protein N8I77_006589 [Diaporthe amygdali]